MTAFIVALDGGPASLAAFAGARGDVRRIAAICRRAERSAVAVAGLDGALTFATVAQEKGERNAIYCRCP